MSGNSHDSAQKLHDFFSVKPDAEEKAWGLIYEFYHQVLTYMEENGITRSDLARKLGKSRAAVSQMFNKNPNITVLKMAEIADVIGMELAIATRDQVNNTEKQPVLVFVGSPFIVDSNQYLTKEFSMDSGHTLVRETRPEYYTTHGYEL